MRFDPVLLRKGLKGPAAADGANVNNTGVQLMLAILAQTEVTLRRRKSFWEVISTYNPLGQFGAAHTDRYSAPPGDQ